MNPVIIVQSELSANSVTLQMLRRGCLEITFESHNGDESWGERLSIEDTIMLKKLLNELSGDKQ